MVELSKEKCLPVPVTCTRSKKSPRYLDFLYVVLGGAAVWVLITRFMG